MKKFTNYEEDLINENKILDKRDDISDEITKNVLSIFDKKAVVPGKEFYDYLNRISKEIAQYGMTGQKPIDL